MIGDNCYYLGFVFTLISLAVTLYLLHNTLSSESKFQDQVREVISGFGVALSSTIAGIVLRVLMLRMAPDIQQIDRDVRRDLDSAVRDFRTHLAMSVGDLKRFSVETTQVLGEQRSAVQRALTEDEEDHVQALEKSISALNRFSKETTRSSEETVKALSNWRASLLRDAERDAEAHGKAVEAIAGVYRETLNGVVEGVSEQRDAILEESRKNVEAYRQTMEGTVSELERIRAATVASLEAFSDYRQEVQRLAALTREMYDGVNESMKTAHRGSDAVKDQIEAMADLSKQSRGLETALGVLLDRMETVQSGIAETVQPAIGRIASDAEGFSSALGNSAEKLKAAANQFDDAARRVVKADAQTTIAKAIEQLEASNATLADVLRRMDETAAKQRGGFFGLGGR